MTAVAGHAGRGALRDRAVHRLPLVQLRARPEHEAALEAAGLVVSARAPDAGVEAVELPGHPFYVATLFQPQVGSSAGRARCTR